MATIVKMKKGGTARLQIENFANVDSFTVPAGFRIQNISVKKSGTTAGNIKLGDYVAAVKEIITLVVTGDPTVNGDISVTLRDATAVLIPVVIADTIATTVTKIAAGVYPGWTVAESLGTTVTWTAVTGGAKTGSNTVTGPTGFAKTGPTVSPAGVDETAGEQTVASVALSTSDGNISDLTVVKAIYAADTPVYLGVSTAATGTLNVALQKIF